MRVPAIFAAIAASLSLAPAALAQGNLSTQGFGYPPGQLSTRALGAGGATGELEPVSPLNPAAIVNWGSSAVFFQANPEYRTLDTGDETQRSTIARYPLTTGALALGSRTYISLSASTFLDRTWVTTEEGSIDLGGTPVATRTSYASEGAINDIRFAAAHAIRPWLRVGLGAHALAGRNRLSIVTTFSDSVAFTPLISANTISYGGNALSAGLEARLGDKWALAASGRMGGGISAERNDTTLSRADVPTRYAFGLGYLGLRGSMLAVRASHEGWSSLSSLGDDGLVAHDAWDLGAGADVAGPRFGRNVLQLRAGVRRRTLPFEAAGGKVTENSVSLGAGTMFANGRVMGDLAIVRAAREASGVDATERAWTVSVGLAIRP